jgi:hypothetical protein
MDRPWQHTTEENGINEIVIGGVVVKLMVEPA